MLELPLSKRLEYSSENELRAFIVKFPPSKESVVQDGDIPEMDLENGRIDEGIDVKVDVNSLVQELVINSSGAKWFESVLRRLLKRLEYDFRITISRLARGPYET